MIQKTEVLKKTYITKKYCDKCGAEIKMDMACSVARCEICVKDLCEKCIEHEENTMGDYREVYCKACWDMGVSYRSRMNELELEIEKLNEEWINKCKS